MSNVYYDPKEFGLSVVDTLEEDLSYEFNILLVLKHDKTGRLFYEQDSGCSCPTPFEDVVFRGPDDTSMTEITPYNIEGFKVSVEDFPVSNKERSAMIKLVTDHFKPKMVKKAVIVPVPAKLQPDKKPLPKLVDLLAEYHNAIGVKTAHKIKDQITELVLTEKFMQDLSESIELTARYVDLYN